MTFNIAALNFLGSVFNAVNTTMPLISGVPPIGLQTAGILQR